MLLDIPISAHTSRIDGLQVARSNISSFLLEHPSASQAIINPCLRVPAQNTCPAAC